MRWLAALAFLCLLPALADAQGLPAGERARGESRCPLGTVGEAMPGGYRCVQPGLVPMPQQGVPVQAAGAAGGQAQEVARGSIGAAWPLAVGGLAILGIGIGIAASQGGGGTTTVSGTR